MVGVLASHPGLKNHRTIVFELAYEEYCMRRKAGESLDAWRVLAAIPVVGAVAVLLHHVPQHVWGTTPIMPNSQGSVAWPEPGSHFLGFDLICEIGRGAMGRVFLASEPALGERRVVLKVALQNGHEAEILGRLRHANIVPVHSIQEDAATGLTAFCMPYLGQATLAAVLDGVYADRRPPLRARAILDAVRAANQGADLPESPPPDRIFRSGSYVEGVIHLGVQLAEALAHAHAHGIFHRDLKPSNVLMSPDGRPLLLDFNLSVDERHPVWTDRRDPALHGAGGAVSPLRRCPSARSPAYRPPQRLVLPGRDPLRVAHGPSPLRRDPRMIVPWKRLPLGCGNSKRKDRVPSSSTTGRSTSGWRG